MTHVCQSWRNVLLSIASLWTQIDFSNSTVSQQKAFVRRSGKQLLDMYHFLDDRDFIHTISITKQNLFRLQGLWITSMVRYLDQFLMAISVAAAPELKYLEIVNETTATEVDIKLPTIFRRQMPKLTNLVLLCIDTNFHGFDFPSLVRFKFETETEISVQDLTSLFERSPLLEFVDINLCYEFQQSTHPPHKRVCLATLQELKLGGAACTSGLLDHLTLPRCTTLMMDCANLGFLYQPVALIHPSSIDHLPVMRGITKAVAVPSLCAYSGPNGTLRLQRPEIFDSNYFTSYSPISVLHIKELVVGAVLNAPWKHAITGICDTFKVLSELEDLTIVSCVAKPFFTSLGTTVDSRILLPGLRRLSVYVGFRDLDIPSLIRSAKARKEHSRLLEEVTVVWEEDPGAGVLQVVEPLREFVGELTLRVGEAPELPWNDDLDNEY